MPQIGKASSAEELATWSNAKLLNEIKKQIRLDCGGKTVKKHLDEKAAEIFEDGLSDRQIEQIADFALWFADKSLKGCRKRIDSKLQELDRRFSNEEI